MIFFKISATYTLIFDLFFSQYFQINKIFHIYDVQAKHFNGHLDLHKTEFNYIVMVTRNETHVYSITPLSLKKGIIIIFNTNHISSVIIQERKKRCRYFGLFLNSQSLQAQSRFKAGIPSSSLQGSKGFLKYNANQIKKF